MSDKEKHIGTVYLVGAGPGDPDLLTVKAARLIGSARLIVHDGLVDQAILNLAAPGAQLISVAKQRARHTLPQDQINALLVAEARKGYDVVRLKGGDPFIFGRGGEEAEDCKAAGVPVQVIPRYQRSQWRSCRSPPPPHASRSIERSHIRRGSM